MRREANQPLAGKSCVFVVGAALLALSVRPAAAQWRNVWHMQTDTGQATTEVDFYVGLDSQGHAVTVGYVEDPFTSYDLLVRKYDRTGRRLWTATYDGGGGGDEFFGNVVFDSADNILTSGTGVNSNGNADIMTVKYSPNGQLLWARHYDGPLGGTDESYGWPSIGIDASDNVYVIGYAQAADGVYEFATIKYDSAGNQVWARHWRGPNPTYPNSYGYSIGIAPGGSVYISGSARNLAGNVDYVLLKYDAAGNLLWERLFDGVHHGDDGAYTLVVDAAENIFVVGISDSQYLNGDFEYCAVKYGSDGTLQWEGRYGGNYGFHYGWIAEPDGAGGVYVSGASMTTGGEYDIVTVRFASNGSLAWAQRFRDPYYFGDDWAYDLHVDLDGNLLVAGYGWNGFGEADNAYLVKYSPGGQLLDSIVYDSPVHGDDGWFAIDVDDAGRVVVAGHSLGLGTGADSSVAKFTTAPAPQLTINPDPLEPARNATFTLTDMEPHSACYLAYSMLGTGNVFVPLLNTTLGIRSPQQAGGIVQSDSGGTAVWQLRIPGNASGANVWFQGAQYNQVSNVVATQVQ